MNKVLRAREGLIFPVNVKILRKNSDGTIIHETAVKNRVLREYGLYSYVRFILGSFNNNAIWDFKQYVPKYLAVGSNKAPLTGAPGTETAVKVSDLSLFHEIDDCAVTGEPIEKNRIKLNRGNFVSDNEEEPFLKVQYEAYIPEDRFVDCEIGELALMTMPTGWNAYARITGFEPFVKGKHEVVQVIWEITIISVESSSRFLPPIKTYLREAVEKAINVLDLWKNDPEGLEGARATLDAMIQPATNVGTGLYYLLNDNDMITQDVINNYLSKPFNSLEDTGLIPLIWKFDPDWRPNTIVPPVGEGIGPGAGNIISVNGYRGPDVVLDGNDIFLTGQNGRTITSELEYLRSLLTSMKGDSVNEILIELSKQITAYLDELKIIAEEI